MSQVPLFDQALSLAEKAQHIPGGTLANIQFVEPLVVNRDVPLWYLNLLADPQTSGGLLISIPEDRVAGYISELAKYPFKAAIVGEIHSRDTHITLRYHL